MVIDKHQQMNILMPLRGRYEDFKIFSGMCNVFSRFETQQGIKVIFFFLVVVKFILAGFIDGMILVCWTLVFCTICVESANILSWVNLIIEEHERFRSSWLNAN